MFCRSISWILLISVAVVTTTDYSTPDLIAGFNSEPTIRRLKTDTTEPSTTEPHQENEQTRATDLGALLDARDDAMVTLVAGDTRLVVHRAVLAARSHVFAAMLAQGALEGSSGEFGLPDVEGPVLRQLLAYLYTLQAPQQPGKASQLLAAADRYGLPALKADCERQLPAQLSVETAAATAVLAVRHSCDSLIKAVIEFTRAHLQQVVFTQGWADAIRFHPEDMLKVSRLLSELQAETSVATPGDCGTAPHPTTQLHGHQRGSSQIPASAAQESTTTPTDGSNISHMSTRAPADSGTAPYPSTQLNSHHSSHGSTPASAGCSTPPVNATAVSLLRSLSKEEKGSRLRAAAREGSVDQIKELLAAGADVAAKDETVDWYQRTALHWAAYYGHVDVVRCLVDAGAQVDVRDRSKNTPLHWAAYLGRAAAVRLLVSYSADTDARDQSGWTPLHFAASQGHTEAATALLEAGADKLARNGKGDTPLAVARQYHRPQMVDLLK